MKKRKPKRSKVKNASLKLNYNSKIRQEYLDLDYLGKLDNKKKNVKLPDGTMVTELEYMAIFMHEWNSAGVGSQKNAKKNRIHRTAKEVKDCTDRNNKRNNDQYGQLKAQGLIYNQDFEVAKEIIERNQPVNGNTAEDLMIELIDLNSTKKLGKPGQNTDD